MVAADAGEEADAGRRLEDDPCGTPGRERSRGSARCVMNPFTLPGPQFLAVLRGLCGRNPAALHFGRRLRESGSLPRAELKDPYLFACLGDGPAQVIRVATVGLVRPGSVEGQRTVPPRRFCTTRPTSACRGSRLNILDHFRGGASLSSAVQNRELTAVAGTDYEHRLRGFGLLPDAATQPCAATRCCALALLALIGVGGAKVLYALSIDAEQCRVPGRPDSGGGLHCDAALESVPHATGRRLSRERPEPVHRPAPARCVAASPATTRDLLWLTALFGVAILPATAFPAIAHVWSRPAASGSGSSCGSGSGGSGCGGGGGGGCGGCGS